MPHYRKYDASVEREVNSIGRAIAKARRDNGLSLAALSALLRDYGVNASPPAISKWETGAHIPSAYQYNALRSALDIEDLLGPEWTPELDDAGLQKLEEYKSDLIATGRYRPQRTVLETVRYAEMPVSMLAVSAGTGAFLDEDSFEMVSFPEHLIPPGAERGIRVSGDSMEPVYHDGQIVWMQRCETLCVGEVGIFLYDGCGYLKEYREQEPEDSVRDSYTDSDGAVRKQPVLVSYNRRYDPIPVAPDNGFLIAGRVLN